MARSRTPSPELLGAQVELWRAKAAELAQRNRELEKQVRTLSKDLADAKFRLKEGRGWGRGR